MAQIEPKHVRENIMYKNKVYLLPNKCILLEFNKWITNIFAGVQKL